MKILFLASSIYEKSLKQFCKNKTGFGIMVNDIIRNVSSFDETYLLTHVITNSEICNGTKIIKHTWKDIFYSISPSYLIRGIKYGIKFRQNVVNRFKYVFYYMDAGFVKKTIMSIKPDVVHIHGIGYATKVYIDVCKELNIPYIVTLHGLIGLGESTLATKQDKELEKKFLQSSEIDNVKITVISSGIKKRIMNNYGLIKGDNISVITNGTNTEIINSKRINIRDKYNIPYDNKIIVCIGNICERKNQVQIVEAIIKIKKDILEKTKVLFLGNDSTNGKFKQYINKSGYEKNFIQCGFIEKKDIASYWEQANVNIVASLDEGFGLSIIEGFVYGVPTVTFSDLDAVEDLYNENVMLLVKERKSQALTREIEKALQITWNKNFIKQYSKQFSLKSMAEEYHKIYLEVVRRRGYDQFGKKG